MALTLTRERSVLAHATLAHVLLARGRPAEAEAAASAGAEDARALQPLVRQEHYVLCLAALCRAVRPIKTGSVAPRAARSSGTTPNSVAPARRIAGCSARWRRRRRPSASAPRPRATTRALKLLDSAVHDSLDYTLWLIAQPGTFAGLAHDAHFALYAAQAAERMTMLQASGPASEAVALALAAAEETAQPRPAYAIEHARHLSRRSRRSPAPSSCCWSGRCASYSLS